MPILIVLGLALPVGARTIEFGGITWTVKNGFAGPGPNNWSDSTQSVWIDAQGNLHLKIRKVGTIWYCAEVTSTQPLGYGTYRFNVASNVDQYDRNIIVGLFTYLNDTTEIDIEFARWGDPQNDAGQFVTQPPIAGNIKRFDAAPAGNESTHSFTWRPQSIFYQSYAGDHESLPPPGGATKVDDWTYIGDDIPAASTERLHINFWLMGGNAPSNGQEAEIVISDVRFTHIPGDCNGDGHGNLSDVAQFDGCLTGPGTPAAGNCNCADLDHDGEISLIDFSKLQEVLVGTCGDGVVNAGEECDPPDGATCAEDCQLIGCGPGAGSCFIANGTPGCEDPECCDLICASFPQCCNIEWTAPCAGFANSFCTL